MKYVVGVVDLDESSFMGSTADNKSLSRSQCQSYYASHIAPYRNLMVHWQDFIVNVNQHSYWGYARLEQTINDGIPAPEPLSLLFGYRAPNPLTKDFLERKRAGEIVVNPHHVWRCNVTSDPVMIDVSTTPSVWTYGWYGRKFGTDTVQWLAAYRRKTVEFKLSFSIDELTRQFDREFMIDQNIDVQLVNDVTSEADGLIFDLLTNVAELPETLKWLADLIKQAAEATKATKRKEVEVVKLLKKKGRTAEQIAKAIANIWMQYRYAIMPISYSIEDVLKTLESWKRTYGKVKDKLVFEYDEETLREFFQINPDHYMSISDASVTHRCQIKRGYDPRGLVDALLQVLKLNPVTTAYELIPLSFVVDWFVNIGQVLSISTAPTHHSMEGATYSWKTEINFTVSDPETDASYSVNYEGYKRRVIDPYAEYGLTLGWDMNWKRYLDSIALLLNPSLKILKNANVR